MRPASVCAILFPLCSMLWGMATAGDFSGVYKAEDEPSLILKLQTQSDGSLTGTLSDPHMSQSLTARYQGLGFAGTIGKGEEAVPFVATVKGERLILEIGDPEDGEQVAFLRQTGAATAGAAADGERKVVINGHRLSAQELAQAEQTYGIRIPDADYWYDPVLGSWGVRGSPTLGFIAPGLRLGGGLQSDASGGGTGVFVNGRELHLLDLRALQQITGPIVPGRYFITAQGLAGYEGGPPQWNLGALVAQSQGGGGSWQTKFSSGISDGQTIGIFLPNGGIVSTGN